MPNYIGSMGTLPPSINELRLQEDARQFDASQGFGNISALLSLLMRKREVDADNAFRDRAFEEDIARRKRDEAAERVARMDQFASAAQAKADRDRALNLDMHMKQTTPSALDMARMYADAARPLGTPMRSSGAGYSMGNTANPGMQRALSALLGIQGNQIGLGPSVAGRVNSALLKQEGAQQLAAMDKAAALAPKPERRGTPNYVSQQASTQNEYPNSRNPLEMGPFPEYAQADQTGTFLMDRTPSPASFLLDFIKRFSR